MQFKLQERKSLNTKFY